MSTDPLFDPQSILKDLPNEPGVYRMINRLGEVIYVGKARYLKKRVSTYFSRVHESPKTAAMVKHIADIAVTITHSEVEALILEHNLIKDLRPRYNIIFKDNKSYPYLVLTEGTYPRLMFYRGARKKGQQYFGPYPSWQTARDSEQILQKIFKLRTCEDSVFQHRTRPCLQYQIKRCTAPCVHFITDKAYQAEVNMARLFLEGKNQDIIDHLSLQMAEAAASFAFEEAAQIRDKIQALRRLQEQQSMQVVSGNTDVIAVAQSHGKAIVELLIIREGQVKGNRAFFPDLKVETSDTDLIEQFIYQYYISSEEKQRLPNTLIVSAINKDIKALRPLLQEQAGHVVHVLHQVTAEKRQWLALAEKNALHQLQVELLKKTTLYSRFAALGTCLGLETPPQRIECFDISHTQGTLTVASCVVFNQEGPLKRDYRYFNIEGITPGDDYAAMHQALSRRYTRLKRGEGVYPDILIIDGGKGQLEQAKTVLADLGIQNIRLLGIAKGITRKPGLEALWLDEQTQSFELPPDSPALHLLQAIRDEAHRFAITRHRQRREKQGRESVLEHIEGIGPKRRLLLLRHFGGLQRLKEVGIEEIAKVEGISNQIAKRIFDALHA